MPVVWNRGWKEGAVHKKSLCPVVLCTYSRSPDLFLLASPTVAGGQRAEWVALGGTRKQSIPVFTYLETWVYGQSPYQDSAFQRVWLKHNLDPKGWKSHVHRGFTWNIESASRRLSDVVNLNHESTIPERFLAQPRGQGAALLLHSRHDSAYTRSPLEDSRLFGPSPWKILRHYLWTNWFLSNPGPGENLLSGNLVMETGCRSGPNGCNILHASIYIYIYIFIHTYVHTYIHTYMHAYIHTYMHAYLHTSTPQNSSWTSSCSLQWTFSDMFPT